MFTESYYKINNGLQEGQHFVVREGELQVRDHNHFWSKIKYFFTRRREETAVRKLISEMIPFVYSHREDWGGDEAFRTFMFEKMVPLTHRIFDRKVITKEMAHLLDPTLPEQQKGLKRRIQKTFLAKKLGIELKPISQGMSGSYFARDYKMKIIGVFKPGREEPLGAHTPKLLQRIKYLFLKVIVGIDTAASFWPKRGYLAEVMSGKCAQHMGSSLVPPSEVVALASSRFVSAKKAGHETCEKGSFQVFAKDTQSADQAFRLNSMVDLMGAFFLKLNLWRYKDKISKVINPQQFEQMTFLDYLICNRDRHFENFLVKNMRRKDKERDIVLIDHALSFPKVNPPARDIFYRRNQYKWERMPQAKNPFSDEIKKRADQKFKGEGLKELLNTLSDVNKDFTKLTEMGSSQEIAFKKRIAVLHCILEEGKTIEELAQIKSGEEIDAFLNERHVDVNIKLGLL